MSYRQATIRPYREEDESVLFSFAREAFGGRGTWNDGGVLTRLERETVFVAEVEREQAGYVALHRDGETVRIEQLLVSPHHEQEGIGHQLVDYAEGYAISQGAARLQIVVEPDNRRALDFYGRRGFLRAGDDLFELVLPHA